MKYTALLLALCAGTGVFAQPAPASGDPATTPNKRLYQLPWPDTQQPKIFKLQPGQDIFNPTEVAVPQKQLMRNDIDRAMIVRPPAGSFIHQQPRTPLAHNLYPDLELLPVETARLEPIPITWKDFKMEPIPITWPKMKPVPVGSQSMKSRR